ncbi:MAG TPA: serine hydrolase domain-containing protein [Bacteroidales bacterium]
MKNFESSFISVLLLLSICYCSFGQIKNLNGKEITSSEIDTFIKAQMDSLKMQGLSIAIINKGKIVYHNAFGVSNAETRDKINEQSIFEGASISKPVFAYFVMRMVDKGVLALDTPLFKYMPYPDIEKDERYKAITARMVLSHQSGFPNWRHNIDIADSNLHVKRGELYLKFNPGTKFSYSGEGYLYLAKVVAHLNNCTLQTLDSVFQQQVVLPLKMRHASFVKNTYISQHKVTGHENERVALYQVDPSFFNPASSLQTDALSYAQFIIAMMNGSGLTNKSYNEMLKPQVMLEKDNNLTGNGVYAWGLGLAIRKTPFGVMYEHGGSNGNFQSMFMFSKTNKNGYVFLTNCDKGNVFDNVLVKFLTNGSL